MASALYEQKQGTKVDLSHCYELLKSQPRRGSEVKAHAKKNAKTRAGDEARPIGNQKKAKSCDREATDAIRTDFREIARREDERAHRRFPTLEEMRDREIR
ncbi:hypothetical protein BX666DRAFT_1879134 [Dichotomocladium elegans]|nr:hypothetical protein BX666DRAFT_1879134 [Dichotomocladium elegans]